MKLEIDFSPLESVDKFYPYRTAKVSDWIVTIHLNEEALEDLREYLKESGYTLDNHTCFTSGAYVFWYTDRWLYIGTTIEEGKY